MVPNLTNHEGQIDGVLSKVAFKRDGDEAVLYTVDVTFTVLNSAEADALDSFFPGAKQTYINCSEKNDDQKEKREVTPVFPSAISIEIASASSGRSLVKGSCKVVKLALSSSKKITSLTAKCQWGGQSEGVAENLAHGLGGPVNFIWEFAQQSLFAGGSSSASVTPKVGEIVCGSDEDGDPVYGQIVEVSEEDKSCLVSNFGDDFQLDFDGIESKWTVNTEDPEYDKCMRSYQERCERRSLFPTWEFLTIAVGKAFQDGEPGDGAHVLTKKIIAEAVKLQEEEAVGIATDHADDEPDGEPESQDPQSDGEPGDGAQAEQTEEGAEPAVAASPVVEPDPVVQPEPVAEVAANAPEAVAESNVIPIGGRKRRKVANLA